MAQEKQQETKEQQKPLSEAEMKEMVKKAAGLDSMKFEQVLAEHPPFANDGQGR